MTIGLLATILLAVLDYTGQANLNVVQIFIPMMIEFGFYILIWLLMGSAAFAFIRKNK